MVAARMTRDWCVFQCRHYSESEAPFDDGEYFIHTRSRGQLSALANCWRKHRKNERGLPSLADLGISGAEFAGRFWRWIFGPEEEHGRTSDVDNVAFPCGYTHQPDGDTIFLYYGGADTCIALATGKISQLLDWLERTGRPQRSSLRDPFDLLFQFPKLEYKDWKTLEEQYAAGSGIA